MATLHDNTFMSKGAAVDELESHGSLAKVISNMNIPIGLRNILHDTFKCSNENQASLVKDKLIGEQCFCEDHNYKCV